MYTPKYMHAYVIRRDGCWRDAPHRRRQGAVRPRGAAHWLRVVEHRAPERGDLCVSVHACVHLYVRMHLSTNVSGFKEKIMYAYFYANGIHIHTHTCNASIGVHVHAWK